MIDDDFDSGVLGGSTTLEWLVPMVFVYFSAGEATWVRSDAVRDAQELWLREGDEHEGTTGTAKDTWDEQVERRGVFDGVGSATAGATEVKTGRWIEGAARPGIGRRYGMETL
jgi:hypothetical protein